MAGTPARDLRRAAPVAGLLIASLASLTLVSGCGGAQESACGGGGDAFSASINGSQTIKLLGCGGNVAAPPLSVTVQPGDSITIRWPQLKTIRVAGTALRARGVDATAVHSGGADIYLVKVATPCSNADKTCPVLRVKVK